MVRQGSVSKIIAQRQSLPVAGLGAGGILDYARAVRSPDGTAWRRARSKENEHKVLHDVHTDGQGASVYSPESIGAGSVCFPSSPGSPLWLPSYPCQL